MLDNHHVEFGCSRQFQSHTAVAGTGDQAPADLDTGFLNHRRFCDCFWRLSCLSVDYRFAGDFLGAEAMNRACVRARKHAAIGNGKVERDAGNFVIGHNLSGVRLNGKDKSFASGNQRPFGQGE